MPKFSIDYQRSHDIDWFVRIGNIYVHAMSFGGVLPDEVNNRYQNTQVLLQAYRMRPVFEQFEYNDGYIERRLRGTNDTIADNKRERYLRHFKEMAARGFYSFDRDLNEDNVYHLITKPVGLDHNMIEYPEMPSLTVEKLRIEGNNEMLIVL